MPDNEPRMKVYLPEELPTEREREAAHYDPRHDRKRLDELEEAQRPSAEALKHGIDRDGAPIACDFCGRELKVKGILRQGIKINGGFFPLAGQANPTGLWTYEEHDKDGMPTHTRTGMDVAVHICYCWKCNRPARGSKLSRVDLAIKSMPHRWFFDDLYSASNDLGAAIRRAYERGRHKEVGRPRNPVRRAQA
jgi:hypothetical protein